MALAATRQAGAGLFLILCCLPTPRGCLPASLSSLGPRLLAASLCSVMARDVEALTAPALAQSHPDGNWQSNCSPHPAPSLRRLPSPLPFAGFLE